MWCQFQYFFYNYQIFGIYGYFGGEMYRKCEKQQFSSSLPEQKVFFSNKLPCGKGPLPANKNCLPKDNKFPKNNHIHHRFKIPFLLIGCNLNFLKKNICLLSRDSSMMHKHITPNFSARETKQINQWGAILFPKTNEDRFRERGNLAVSIVLISVFLLFY